MTSKKGLSCRRFYSLPENPSRGTRKFSVSCRKREDIAKLVKYVDDNVIGKNITFSGPYGRRKVVYCDYGSSGRSLQFIEDYILKEVLPGCGEIHNASSITSLQSNIFRHEANGIVRTCVNASDDDEIIFASHGSSGALKKLIEVLDFQEPPVVFVGPSEQQSTLHPWRQLGAKIVRISESKEGFLDLDDLETQLLAHQGWGAHLIGCFSAASSITGILADDVATTLLLHQHGALAIWDYATAASFVTLDMNPTLPGMGEHAVHKDAIYFSAHQFLGGVQTPGILIVKKRLLKTSVTTHFKGDELSCACKENQRCLQESEPAEEDGASDLVETVRAGLVMQLKAAVGVPAIMSRAEKITRMVLAHVRNIPELILLGNSSHSLRRLPTFSFVVRHPRGTFLHHNFVCSILNDIFGIQASSAHICGGPYSQDLMGIDNKLAEEYEKILLEKKKDDEDEEEYSSYEILRPGFSRISLPYCINESDLGFILEALKMVATEAWKLLPQYIMIPETAEWRHHSNSVFRDKKCLSCVRYVEGRMIIHERKISAQGTSPADYAECLHVARSIFNKARKMAQRYPQTLQRYVFNDRIDPLRWFMLPSEAHNLLLGNSQNVKHKVPFDPVRYTGCKGDPLEVNIAKIFSGEGKSKMPNDKTSASDVPSTTINYPANSDSTHSNNLVQMSNSVCMPNNLSPKIPGHLQPERQNSFSSDISNSDYSFDVSSFQPNSVYSSNVCSSYVGMCQSPVRNYPETLCYSPQPLTSPVMNPTDLTSHFAIQHTNYGLTQPTNYGNYCNGNMASSYDNNYNNPYIEKCSKVMNSNSNYCGLDHLNGKIESHYPTNKVHFALGPTETSTRQRCNSLGSSLILNPKSRTSLGISCRSLTDGEASLNVSECSLSSNEDIHAYVTEVTKELATEIKSEIREVISKVEDVLSESVDNDNCGYSLSDHRGSRSLEARSSVSEKLERTNSLPSATASDIAQYLMGVSKEMAEEMKSEIRGLVSSVVSPDTSPMPDKKSKKVTIEANEEVKGAAGELKKSDMTKFEDISQSRDSGINLSYSETSIEPKGKEKESGDEKTGSYSNSVRDRSESLDSFQENDKTVGCRSESLDSLQGNDDSDAVGKFEFPKRKTSKGSKKVDKSFSKNNFSGESSNDEGMNADVCSHPKWHCPSKAIWKPTVEAIEEFDMVKNGDKILICLSSGTYCLSLLHALYRYRFHASSRGIQFELGVILGGCKNEPDDSQLLSYLDVLGIPCLDEDLSDEEQNIPDDNSVCSSCSRIKQTHLFTIAKNKEFNVIAFDQHLDDVAESFLTSVFYNGKLASVKAHYFSTAKDIRIIRPFVYVREKALRQFSESRNLPVTSHNCSQCFDIPKERHRSKQLLAQQESAFPRLFVSLKTALHPLISSRHADQPYNYTVDSDEVSLP